MNQYEFIKASFDVMHDICDFCAKKAAFYEARSEDNPVNVAKAIVYRETINAIEKRECKSLPWENSEKVFLKDAAAAVFGIPK